MGLGRESWWHSLAANQSELADIIALVAAGEPETHYGQPLELGQPRAYGECPAREGACGFDAINMPGAGNVERVCRLGAACVAPLGNEL